MNYKSVCVKMFCIFLAVMLLNLFPLLQANAQEPGTDSNFYYKIRPVYVPPPKRPPVQYELERLPIEKLCGLLSTYDGEHFQLYFDGKGIKSGGNARELMIQFLDSLEIPLKLDNQLRKRIDTTTSKTDERYIEEQIKIGQDLTEKRLLGQFGKISKSSYDMIDELGNELRKQASTTITIYSYDQYFENTLIDNTSINIAVRNKNKIASLYGRFYTLIDTTNERILSADEAIEKAIAQLKEQYKLDTITGDTKNAAIVLLPYEAGFKFAWKTEIIADGPYKTWIDAKTGKILQLFPEFFFADNARGLVFNPDPNTGTIVMTFEVDAPSGGKYTLNKTGVLTLTNYEADGTTGIVTVNDDGSGTADFNVAPINGTTVERTNQTGYNGLFQQVNIYAHLFNERRMYMILGSENFDQLNVSFNKPGGNSYCCPPKFHIGRATVGTSISCYDEFNGGIDATVIAHEFGHKLNSLQYGVGGGSMTGAINEGLCDFWACTNFNTDIFGGYWGHNCASPTQTGWVPRQAEASDIFPDHFSTGGSTQIHSAGQIMAWANWRARQGMNDVIAFGTISINLNIIKAMTTAGNGVLNNGTEESIHDSYQDLLKQLVPLYCDSRLIHKLLAGYARAGIFLSPKDAIIDIDDSYLDRNSTIGPTFTVWTGADYTFNADNSVNTGSQPFNTQFMVEIANDEAFTTNLVNSGWLGGVTSGAGGTATWALPVSDWNTLKVGDAIYYRVTTKDASGGNIRKSWHPGNNICLTVPVGKAAINETGEMDICCSAAGATSNPAMALIPVIPIIIMLVFRRIFRKDSLFKNAKSNN